MITTTNSSAVVKQASIDENGEGSAFITIGKLCYEVCFYVEKDSKEVLLMIDTANDSENLNATRKVVAYLDEKGIPVRILDEKAYKLLEVEFDNIVYTDIAVKDNFPFDFDDEYTENVEGDYMPLYNSFENAYCKTKESKLIMTIHPQEKGEKTFEVFKDQIGYMLLNNAEFIE